MRDALIVLNMVVVCVVIFLVIETTYRGYQWLFPRTPQKMVIIVEHNITADGIDGTFDITTDVISVAIAIEEATREAIGRR